MSTPRQAADPDDSYSSSPPAHRSRTAGWVVGLALFAGVMMIITGVFNAMEGVVALARNEVYVAAPRYIFAFDLTTWGWIQVVIGLVVTGRGIRRGDGSALGPGGRHHRRLAEHARELRVRPLLPGVVPADHRAGCLRDLGTVRLQPGCRCCCRLSSGATWSVGEVAFLTVGSQGIEQTAGSERASTFRRRGRRHRPGRDPRRSTAARSSHAAARIRDDHQRRRRTEQARRQTATRGDQPNDGRRGEAGGTAAGQRPGCHARCPVGSATGPRAIGRQAALHRRGVTGGQAGGDLE